MLIFIRFWDTNTTTDNEVCSCQSGDWYSYYRFLENLRSHFAIPTDTRAIA
ncbi:hypothetical protein [Microcoleus sp.]|uniref:hypothetical protein n=1 Tax=Microcoleus sp. TaxID=44472 RepID=UPI003523C281